MGINLGVALYQTGRKQEALAEFLEASRLAPGRADAAYNAEVVAKELGATKPP